MVGIVAVAGRELGRAVATAGRPLLDAAAATTAAAPTATTGHAVRVLVRDRDSGAVPDVHRVPLHCKHKDWSGLEVEVMC